MTAFVWQTLLLLGLAYVLGCWIACLVRRMVSSPTVEARSVSSIPAGAIAGAAAAGAAMRPVSLPSPSVPRTPAPVPVRDAFRRADALEPEAVGASRASMRVPQSASDESPGAVARFERALTGPHDASQVASAGVPDQGALDASTASVARSRAAGPTADDLKRIRHIDPSIEAALHRLGIRTFAEIGAWKPADVARISHALGFKGRVEQENWIEQAQILASGRDTYYSSRLGRMDHRSDSASTLPRPTSPQPSDQVPARPASSSSAAASPRGGLEAATATAAAMAAASAAARSITSDTEPAERKAEPSTQAPTQSSVPPSSPASTVPARPAVSARDDLGRIKGITPEIERLLNTHGISRYGQIAKWSAGDIERLGRMLGHPGRIERENWVEQAHRLAAADSNAPPGQVPAPKPTAPSTSPPAGSAAPATTSTPPVQPTSPAAVTAKPASGPAGPATPSPQAAAKPAAPVAAPGAGPSIPAPVPSQPQASPVSPQAAAAKPAAPAAAPAPGPSTPAPGPSQSQAPSGAQQAAGAKPVGAQTPSAPSSSAPPVPSPTQASPAAQATPAKPAEPGTSPAQGAVAAGAAALATIAASAAQGSGPASTTPSSAETAPPRPARLADAIRENAVDAATGEAARGDLASLRSVRSEALRGPTNPFDSRPAGNDDLKRIRGIGVLIEKKLNSMGVTRYAQIAAWTSTDIDRVSHALDFKGRIERENWVEQARILASGGHTEFSRRADRGEFGGA
ncbi:MAG: hypothetical protein R3D44_12740 [Hyphomicrobiaceae bacterium]